MGIKIGRNKPCWCGSGKKYKRCHYRREQEQLATKQEIVKTFRNAFKKAVCLHPQAPDKCRGKIIKAHTIQKNGGLSKIAHVKHVYTLIPSINSEDPIKLQGINKASTFTGFCGYHDNLLFAPIEDNDLETNEEHALLLMFRAFSKELYLKHRSYELIPYEKSLDRGRDKAQQRRIQEDFSLYEFGVIASICDLEREKELMDRALLTGEYNNIYYYAVRISETPEVLCSGGIYPEYDFHGNLVNDLLHTTLNGLKADGIAFSLLATDYGGIAFFGWVGQSETNIRFIQSLHSLLDDEITHAILRFAFEYFENIYISPIWWDNLSPETKTMIMKHIYSGLEVNTRRTADSITDDGMRSISWTVSKRETNISL